MARTTSEPPSFEPTGTWLPPALVWGLQVVAVVGGHMIGAWAGHVVASREAGHLGLATARQIRMRQVPLAVVMVALTTLTLWSLGQAIVHRRVVRPTRADQGNPIDE